ncbi:MAG: hypothetical protein M1495_23440 [Bacteroidetes bacterium]|nr:hypothetical protein [Bacteroidota bacterium]
MKRMRGGFRDFIERFYPSNPFAISFSFPRYFVLILIMSAVAGVFYLRSHNKNELEILKAKHKEIQLIVAEYLDETTSTNLSSDKVATLNKKLEDYKRNLRMIETKIEHLQRFWFLE